MKPGFSLSRIWLLVVMSLSAIVSACSLNNDDADAALLVVAISGPTGGNAAAAGSQVQLNAFGGFGIPGDTADPTVEDITNLATWTSSVPSVATVSNSPDSKGQVSALSVGTTIIQVEYLGLTASFQFDVTDIELMSL